MRAFATLIVRCCDLLEAEGRSLRAAALQLGMAMMLVVVGGVLGVLGLGLAIWACHLWLTMLLGAAAASFIMAVVVIAAAGTLIWSAKRINR